MTPRLQPLVSRREALCRTAIGFGAIGLAGSLQTAAWPAAARAAANRPLSAGHFAPRARRVIYLFMNGGPSHVDTFDPKPALKRHEGELPSGNTQRKKKGGFVPSPFRFAPHGESGVVMSELFPNLARCADDLCVIRSMHTDVPNHEPGLLLMNAGHQQPVRPSLGSWVSYGLGTENQNLPAFIVLATRRPVVGPALWSNSFLPGAYQGMAVDTTEMDLRKLVANLNHPNLNRQQQREQLDLLVRLNQMHLARRAQDAALEAQIQAMETAYQMQAEASTAFDIRREPEYLQEAYGRTNFGQSCLLARRLCEHGVRFIQVYYLAKDNNQPWDTHSNNDDGHRRLCRDADQATAALITDLKQRGLLDDTLVVWGGEFGRTPYAELQDKARHGRDHHHTGFTVLLAGGGVRGGLMYGATDELGMHAVHNRVHVHDLHATMLHLLGIDHERLTYHYSGRDFRLTDIHGRVVHDVIA